MSTKRGKHCFNTSDYKLFVNYFLPRNGSIDGKIINPCSKNRQTDIKIFPVILFCASNTSDHGLTCFIINITIDFDIIKNQVKYKIILTIFRAENKKCQL